MSPTPSESRSLLWPILTCCAVAANAICAGGVYSFPLIAPALVEQLKLTQPQLTTIALAGMAGQYPIAAVVGIVIDRYGAWTCSLAASLLFSLGFGIFAREVATSSPDAHVTATTFNVLVLCFVLLGLATVASYFSLVFAATKTFPQYIGIASGTSMAVFGLSPLFLSLLASRFTPPGETLDIPAFFACMATLTGITHLGTSLIFRRAQKYFAIPFGADLTQEDTESLPALGSQSSEEDPLLGGDESDRDSAPKDPTDVHVSPVEEPQEGSTLDLFRDPYFWVLSLWMTIVVGVAEMVVSNLGSIILALPSSAPGSTTANVARQVRLLALANTLSRLAIGPIADALAPVAARRADGVWAFARARTISRVVFMIGSAALLAVTCAWLAGMVRSQETVWPLSIGTGVAYGSVFTVLPGILSSIYGMTNLGRNFGIISYTAFVGTTVFSYLYAFIADRHVAPGADACTGIECWRATFWISLGASLIACTAAGALWQRWKARV